MSGSSPERTSCSDVSRFGGALFRNSVLKGRTVLQQFSGWITPGVLLTLASCRSEPESIGQPEAREILPRTGSVTASTGAPQAPHNEPVVAPARVDLAGQDAALSHALIDEGPRIYATHLRTWVYDQPRRQSRKLGYLRAGSSVPVAEQDSGRSGCRGGWRKVEPEGYVCVGPRATLDPGHPVAKLYEAHPPRSDQRLPYRYGTVRKPGPAYRRLPAASELLEAEPTFRERYPLWLTIGGEIGAAFRPTVWTWGRADVPPSQAYEQGLTRGVPEFLSGSALLPSPLGRPRPATVVLDRLEARVGYSFLHTFYWEGRRYGLSTHLELAPLDRFRPIVGSDFHGVEIGKDVELPFAFVRRVDAKFRDGGRAEYRRVLALTGKKRFFDQRLHYETKDGKYISDRYASEVRLAKKMPGWAKRGEKWMSVSIGKQLLVAYEGEQPVFATLVSTGEAGLESPDTTTATKRGWFRVHTKHITSTMASDESGEEFELRDVPYVQYFAEGGYALHGAYWHDRFGMPKSHGCINLSPEDARRLFHWTEPSVPVGWHGALSPLRGTIIFVHP